MKKIILSSMLCLLGIACSYSQEIKKLDASPLDLAVFRPDDADSRPLARIIYSRPQKKGRVIFGELVPYGKLWRTGANQSTEINLYQDITFEGKKLAAGDYTIYTIPGEKEWTIILNSELFTWGTYDYDESKNVMSIVVPANKADTVREEFGMAFSGKDGSGKLLMAWENTKVFIDFEY